MGLKVGVCECSPEMRPGSSEWDALCRSVSRESPDLFLLNEMPFGAWISSAPKFDADTWKNTCRLHEEGIQQLAELGAVVVAGSRPRELNGRRVNQAFLWTRDEGVRGVHTKQYFPDEEGYYEARWFEAGDRHFQLASSGAIRAGFLICTELMFNEHARRYGRDGAHVILTPRAAGEQSLRRWLVATRMAAIGSGSDVLSSTRSGTDARGQVFGGGSWIVNPEGDVVAQTSPVAPVVFHEIDLDFVTRMQKAYPCYVKE